MTRKRCTPAENVRREKIRELLQMENIGSMDDIHYHVRSEGQIVKKAVYIAIGVNLDIRKDVLGMWVGENESAKFWTTVLNGLKNRGVEDIFIAYTDNLTPRSMPRSLRLRYRTVSSTRSGTPASTCLIRT